MATVGAFEAKTHLSQLLDRVERGEEIVITRHGTPVARLVPPAAKSTGAAIELLVEKIRNERQGKSLGGLTIKELTHGGHKY